jgi:hypothetical protein
MSEVGTGHPAIAKVDALFQQRVTQVPVLRQRAGAEGVREIRFLEDMVPLLFPHTVYKSYPAPLVDNGRWAQLNRWLSSVSARPIDVDVDGVENVDQWMDRLGEAGHFVSQSSGTTGKSSFLVKSQADLDASASNHVDLLSAAGLAKDCGWNVISLSPSGNTNVLARHMAEKVLGRNFARADGIKPFQGAPQTESQRAYMARMIRLQRALTEGTASPDEIAAMREEQARRQAESEQALEVMADRILERRSERMLFGTMMAQAWRLVETLRARGVQPGEISGENAVYMAGGTKGVVLPPDHEEAIRAMLNVSAERFVQLYSMQEINQGMARCTAGRYHVGPELVLLVLDDAGEALARPSDGEVEGRAAFFDMTIDARWGGIMSGDNIRADLKGCPCGRTGPSIHGDISRYANKVDGDKITCAGTMDAYVRGIIEE